MELGFQSSATMAAHYPSPVRFPFAYFPFPLHFSPQASPSGWQGSMFEYAGLLYGLISVYEEKYGGMVEKASQSGKTNAPNEAYFKAVDGRKRGGALSLGSALNVYYQKLRTRTPSDMAYAPFVIVQLTSKIDEVTQIREALG